MTLLIEPAALRDLSAGQPLLLVLEGVEDAAALALPGLSLWLVYPDVAGQRLYRPGGDPARAVLPLPAPPAGALAVIAPDRARAAPLLAAWTEAAPEAPPLIEATTAAAALAALAPRALASLAAERVRAGELQHAMAMLRQEAEETREAMLALLTAFGDQAPPPVPVLALAAEPSAAHALAMPAGQAHLGQGLGVSLEGLAALALHVQEAPAAPGARLKLRLYGAESGRIFGSWTLPGEALTPGWLTLDLPSPIGPVRETACLDLRAELPEGDRLALSLEDRLAPQDRAVSLEGTGPQERALALRLWTAPFGRRFTLAQHWNWEELDLPLLPAGVPVRLPSQLWSSALLPSGRVERVALGAEAPSLVATLGGGERCLIVLPAVPVSGIDLLRAELAVRLGDPALLEAALWLQPAGSWVAAEEDLSLLAPGTRWSGWRKPGPVGAPGSGTLRIALALPLDAPAMLCAVLVLRNRGAAPEDLLRVEWAELTGCRLVERVAANPAASAERARPAAAMPRLPEGEAPQVKDIRLQEHFQTPDGGYRHLDIAMDGVQAGGFAWPRLRFKLADGGGGPVLEFRARPDWPLMFEAWPGRQADEYGPFLLIRTADLAGAFPTRLKSERDRWMLLALVRLLPTAVASAAREAVGDPAEYQGWLDLARRLAEALPREAG